MKYCLKYIKNVTALASIINCIQSKRTALKKKKENYVNNQLMQKCQLQVTHTGSKLQL